MKKYLKPEIENLTVTPLNNIAAEGGLESWLNNSQLDSDTNISTFEFISC